MDEFSNVIRWAGELGPMWGPLAGLLVWFIWRDYKREEALGKALDKERERITGLESDQKGIILKILNDTSQLVVSNTRAFIQFSEALKSLPCVYAKNFDDPRSDGSDKGMTIDG